MVAVDLALIAVGLALGSDRDAAFDEVWDDEAPSRGASSASVGRVRSLLAATLPLDGRQMLIGLLFGLAATARLPVILGAPFFMLVGAGDTWQRRSLSAGFGALIPVLGLLTYNVASTGSLFHPAYEWQYQREAQGYTALGYHPEWSIEDVRYIPQNLGIMFGSLPDVLPDARTYALGPDFLPDEPVCVDPGSTRGLFDPDCPLALPRDIGTSLLVSSPAYLLLLWPLRRWGRSRLVTGAIVAIVLIALLNLAHFSQGWVQWGYRFSNDLVPFALPLIALGAAGHDGRVRLVAFTLVVLSVLINVWGVIWGNLLGW